MKKILILVSFLLAISTMVFSQIKSQINPEILTHVEGNYVNGEYIKGKHYYQNKMYKNRKLSPVLEVNPKAHEVYKKYLRGRKRTAALGAFSILGVGGGSFLFTRDPCRNRDTPDECDVFFYWEQVIGIGIVSGSVVAGIEALAEGKRTKKKLRKSVGIFNEGLTPSVGVLPIELNLKITNHGVGLVLNF